jgi:hypothetical protein
MGTHSSQGKGERRAGVTVVVDTSRDGLEVRGKDSRDSTGCKNAVRFLEKNQINQDGGGKRTELTV